MKSKIIIRMLLATILTVTLKSQAVAGPGQIYVPVTTMRQAEAIKPGARIAMECPKCGGIKTMIAGENRSYLHSYTCDTCKQKFVVRPDPHGGIRSTYICEDDGGHRAKLLQAM